MTRAGSVEARPVATRGEACVTRFVMAGHVNALCAVLGVLLVAGCGAGSGDAAGDKAIAGSSTTASSQPASSAVPSSAVASSAVTGSAAASSTAAVSPTLPPARRAANGTRYSACRDGNCEVAVSGKTRIKFTDGTLSLSKVRANDGLNFKLSLASGAGATGTLKGTCGTIAYFYLGGSGGRMVTCGASGKPARPKPYPGELALQLVGWTSDGAAVLRLATG
jgi:hypothetical protein